MPRRLGTLETHRRIIMKVRKNIEGLFLVAAAVGVFASYASAETIVAPAPMMAATVKAVAVAEPAIPTVMVVGHRLTAAERANLG